MDEKIQKLVDEICQLTALEISELAKALREKLGISLQSQQITAQQPQEEERPKEKTEFDIVLKEVGLQKINVIKLVREITNKQLMECKTFVENAPQIVVRGLTKENAEEIKARFENLGATMEIV